MMKPEISWNPLQYLDYIHRLYSIRTTGPTSHRSLIWTPPNYFLVGTNNWSILEMDSFGRRAAEVMSIWLDFPEEGDVSYYRKRRATLTTPLYQVRVAMLQQDKRQNGCVLTIDDWKLVYEIIETLTSIQTIPPQC